MRKTAAFAICVWPIFLLSLCATAYAQESIGTVLFASKKCALIDGPLHFAFVTGKLEVKKGDLVKGDFGFQSFGTLYGAYGEPVGWDVYVEDIATSPSKVEGMVKAQHRKCGT